MTTKIEFSEGAMWEEYPWLIEFDHDCTDFGGAPCRHCHGFKTETRTRSDGSTYKIKHWTCPRVVVAFNEASYSSTGVCLDCILEAAASLPMSEEK